MAHLFLIGEYCALDQGSLKKTIFLMNLFTSSFEAIKTNDVKLMSRN